MTDKIDELREYYDTTDTSAELESASLEQPDTTAEPMVTYALRLPKPVLDDLRAGRHAQRPRQCTHAQLARGTTGTETAGQNRVIAVDDLLALVAERGHPAGGQGAA